MIHHEIKNIKEMQKRSIELGQYADKIGEYAKTLNKSFSEVISIFANDVNEYNKFLDYCKSQ